MLAVQGPTALEAVQPLTGVDLRGLEHYAFAHGEVAGVRATVSRTGYTGEDGFEIFVPPQSADKVWQAILASGGPSASFPPAWVRATLCGSKRRMRLYGRDIDETTTPVEADLGWMVGWDKGDFTGAALLRAQKERGAVAN